MKTPKHYTAEGAKFMRRNADKMTGRAIAEHLGIDPQVVYNFGFRHGVAFKRGTWEHVNTRKEKDMGKRERTAPAVYSNSRSPYGIATEFNRAI